MDEPAIAFLEKNHAAAMTTLRADGTPHTVRVGVALVDGKVWISATQGGCGRGTCGAIRERR